VSRGSDLWRVDDCGNGDRAIVCVSGAQRPKAYAAVAFDYFVLFNPDSVVSAVDRIAPGHGRDVTNLWRTRQFEYSWLRSITGHYVDFYAITRDALLYAANAMHVELTAAQRDQLLDAYRQLTPWPDTADVK
jgi:2-haloacid dehalogenase